MIKRFVGLLTFLILTINAYGQSSLKAGNKYFDRLIYLDAAKTYEAFLAEAKSNDPDRAEAISKMAYSYKKLQDFTNAERAYRDLFKYHEKVLDSKEYLNFAQVLASNSKYRESQKYYALFAERQTSDQRAKNFAIAYLDQSPFYRDSSLYNVRFLDVLNTEYSDFSPAYYGKGLVFVSAREDNGLFKKVFLNNQTPFLDLFEYPDTAQLAADYAGISENLIKKATETASLETNTGFSKDINSKYHEGPVSFFNDYKQIVFTRNNYSGGKAGKGDDRVVKLKLFSAKYNGSEWDFIEELPFNSEDYSCGHPALAPDNSKMYFVSDMPGGYGGTDIYMVTYTGGHWGLPQNLGPDLNTEGNEMFPFVDELGNLYFASDGHAGLGGLDIFYAELNPDGSAVAKPQNLGYPINSEKDDFGLITNKERSSGFFASNRKVGYADDNLYSFSRRCRELKVIVLEESTGMPLAGAEVRVKKYGINQELYMTDAEGSITICMAAGLDFEFKAYMDGYESNSVTYGSMATSPNSGAMLKIYLSESQLPIVKGTIRSELTNEPIAGAMVTLLNERDGTTESVVTGKDGKYEFQPTKKGKYSVSAVKEKYATNTEEIGKIKAKKKEFVSYEQNLGMIAEGDIFRIENIYYDYGKASIRKDARKELENTVLPVLLKYPQITIELRSHTDSRSSSEFNQELSEARALSVADFLNSRGIATTRLIAKGYGESMLVNGCADGVDCSENKHQQNRRTEFRILNISEQTAHN